MAVVDLGTWHTRAGYVGDAVCMCHLPSIGSNTACDEMDFMSIMRGACRAAWLHQNPSSLFVCSNDDARVCCATKDNMVTNDYSVAGSSRPTPLRDDVGGEKGRFGCAQPPFLTPLWTLPSFRQNKELHVRHLRSIKYDVLRCSEDDPLLLVVPESWHRCRDVMHSLLECLLEDSGGDGGCGEKEDAKDLPGVAPMLYCARPSVCWTLSTGLTSSVTLDVGHTHTTLAAVLDGYVLNETVASHEVGGAAITRRYVEIAASSTGAAAAAACEHEENTQKGSRGKSTLSCETRSSLANQWYRGICSTEARVYLMRDFMSDVKQMCGHVAPRRGRGDNEEGNKDAACAGGTQQRTNAVVPAGQHSSLPQKEKLSQAGSFTTCTGAISLHAPDGSMLTFSSSQRCDPFELLFVRGYHHHSAGDTCSRVRCREYETQTQQDGRTDQQGAGAWCRDRDELSDYGANSAADARGAATGINIADMLVRCTQSLDVEWRWRGVNHILAGGTSQTRGLYSRVVQELKERDASYYRLESTGALRVVPSPDGAWTGASVSGSSSSFEPFWVSRAEWAEEGDGVMTRKFL